jgi:hypothetical protein
LNPGGTCNVAGSVAGWSLPAVALAHRGRGPTVVAVFGNGDSGLKSVEPRRRPAIRAGFDRELRAVVQLDLQDADGCGDPSEFFASMRISFFPGRSSALALALVGAFHASLSASFCAVEQGDAGVIDGELERGGFYVALEIEFLAQGHLLILFGLLGEPDPLWVGEGDDRNCDRGEENGES